MSLQFLRSDKRTLGTPADEFLGPDQEDGFTRIRCPAVQLATFELQSLVLRLDRDSRSSLSVVRYALEHVLDEGALSGLQPPMALDFLSALSAGVVA